MSGAAINRNLCAKHVPVVVNAIKNLEKQVVNKNNIKQLIIKNVKFTPRMHTGIPVIRNGKLHQITLTYPQA